MCTIASEDISPFFHASLPSNSSVFPEVRVFDVSNNRLSGTVPAAFNSSGAFNSALVRHNASVTYIVVLVNRALSDLQAELCFTNAGY